MTWYTGAFAVLAALGLLVVQMAGLWSMRDARAQGSEGAVRVAILYGADSDTANANAGLLDDFGFDAQTFSVAAPDLPTPSPSPSPSPSVTPSNQLALPHIEKAGDDELAQVASVQNIPDFKQFDLLLIGPDTGAGDIWSPESGLVDAIEQSGLPVIGIGAGGHAFFGQLGLVIGHPNGDEVQTDSVKVADTNSLDAYEGIQEPENQIVQVFSQVQTAIAVALEAEPGDPTKANTAAQLVNDLDLVVEEPDGNIFRPWVLAPLPMSATPISGTADPIVRNTHVVPAGRGVDSLNNVEQVVVTDTTELQPGNWTIRVTASALPNNNTQPYALAGDFRGLNIVSSQTGDVVEAGDPANPNVILVVVEAEQTLTGSTLSGTMQDAVAADFSVEIDGNPATIINGLPVGDAEGGGYAISSGSMYVHRQASIPAAANMT